jgi:predicted NAD/FAD-dependent oxidoreductase
VRDVVVVGAGIAGVTCARTLAAAGVPVRVVDRGRRLGGRMAVRTVEGRPVDIGAAYFTARDPRFATVVDGWQHRGLAREWTDTFHVASIDGIDGTTVGPMRYAAPRGLRSLVEDLAEGLRVEHPRDVDDVASGPTVDGEMVEAVVLAVPGPQALDVLGDDLPSVQSAADGDWAPSIALYAGWDRRRWSDIDGVFVGDSPLLTWVADDGRRRGDDAPVLVAHSTSVLAAAHIDDADAAVVPMLEELCSLLRIDVPPAWTACQRWSLARPQHPRPEPYFLDEALVGLCGDAWGGHPRVEAAYLSGLALGEELVRRLS